MHRGEAASEMGSREVQTLIVDALDHEAISREPNLPQQWWRVADDGSGQEPSEQCGSLGPRVCVARA